MWQGMDWGWGIGLHMLAWWLIAVLGVAAVAALIVILSRRADRDASRP
jgi:hypothetical protein